ncbi:MAG: RsmD family RNA methyltransferase [Tannerella sp.]|jgi:16S rRNA (guanine(966)-N(2))-methyltransferase RsmD|nr:RsmD family RNA methyltransferase [Tannerella sp.]
MRIIRGKYGRRRFRVPSAFKARPTTDFAKENLFNILENIVCWDDLIALDIFAGTGSISFELLSRGCKYVTAVESDFNHAAFISKVAKELKTDNFNLIKGDVFRFLHSPAKDKYNFIFADPPYTLQKLEHLPDYIFESGLLAESGIFILEHSKQYEFSSSAYFHQKRTYGSVNFSFFVRAAEKTDA